MQFRRSRHMKCQDNSGKHQEGFGPETCMETRVWARYEFVVYALVWLYNGLGIQV